MMIPQKNNLVFVRQYRKDGLNVIPCKKADKVPLIEWKKYQDIFYDGEISFDSNVAIICGKVSGNLLVVDVDKSDFALVNHIYPDALKQTRVVKTGRGGYHIYFRVTELPKKALRLNKPNGDHIDVQVNGTYVIAPPSIHPNGHEYQVISETQTIKNIDFRKEIQPNLEKLGFKVKQTTSSDLHKGRVEKGNRHNMALKYCCTLLLRHDFDSETVYHNMYDWNETNQPPIPKEELDRIIADSISFSENEKKKVIESSGKKYPKNDHGKIANLIVEKNHFRTLIETEEILVYEHGCYQPYGKIKIKEECELIADDCYNSLVSEVIGTIQRRTFVSRDDFDKLPHLLNLQNGVLCTICGKMIQHKPTHLFRVQLPIEYNPNAIPVKIIKFLKDIAPPQYFLWILDMMAYCLVRNCKQDKGLFLIGDGGNGKSTLLKLLTKFLGSDNVSNHSTYELQSDRFAKADLDGKLANIHADVESDEIKRTGILKELISGDPIEVQKKNQNPYSMVAFAKLIFSANQLPDVGEETQAFFDRWIVIHFERRFRGTKTENKQLIEELTTEKELSGLLNVLIKRMPKFLSKKGAFQNTPDGMELKRTWKDHANSIDSFINNEVKMEENAKIRKSDIFKIFVLFCKRRKFKLIPERTFSQRFKEKLIDVVKDSVYQENGKSARFWVNITLKNPPKNSNHKTVVDY